MKKPNRIARKGDTARSRAQAKRPASSAEQKPAPKEPSGEEAFAQQMKYPMLDLETEIYTTEALLDLLSNEIIAYLHEQEHDPSARVAAGLVNLTMERRQSLKDAYYAAFAEYAQMKTRHAPPPSA